MKKFLLAIILAFTSVISVMAAGHVATATGTSTCIGTCNATANAMAAGGVGPYGFTWTGPNSYTATGTNITGLCSGTYIVTAIDSSDMSTAIYTLVINALALPIATATPSSQTICSGVSTSIVLSSNIGGTTYTWVANSSAGVAGASNCASACGNTISNTLIDFASGTGNVTYTIIPNTAGCVGSSITVPVTVLAAPIATATPSSQTICSGGTTSISISVDIPFSTYTWTVAENGVVGGSASNGGSAINQTLVCAGLGGTATYQIVATNNGCVGAPVNAVVVVNAPPIVTATVTSNANCGIPNGSAIANVVAGSGPFTFMWSDPFNQTTQVATSLSAGVYNVTVGDVNGCFASTSVNIGNTGGLNSVATTTVNTACLSNSGEINIGAITGGVPPYQYSFNGGAYTTTTHYTGLAAGNYYIMVADSAGCTYSLMDTVYAGVHTIYGSVSTTNANCGNPASASVIASGGSPPYTYLWNTTPVQTTATAAGLGGGNYHCTITDTSGCSTIVYTTVHSNCYNVIKGTIYNDVNNNCVQDVGESGIQGISLYTNNGGYGYTDANGNYTILTTGMNNTVTRYSYGTMNYNTPTCPATNALTVNFTNMGDTLYNNNFGLYSNPNYVDVGIHPGWTSANPGFSKEYWILYNNNSPTTQNVLIRFIYDSTLQYTSCTQGGINYPAQHKIEWTINNVPSHAWWDWSTRPEAYFMLPTTLTTASLLNSYFEILPIIGDVNPSDNTYSYIEPVTSCHDPNSKGVIPRGQGPNGNIETKDSTLLYTIHFQNDGNDTAHFIIVKDTLSPFLDPATVVPGASSHPYTFDLSEHGILTFTFNNIMLPDSIADEPKSNGYFNFTVKQRVNNPIGAVINNTAGIYFDYNLPVITNTTVNTIVDMASGIVESSTNAAIKVYPNPFSENTTFVIQSDKINEKYSFELTDVLGKKVKMMNNIFEKQFSISRSELKNGIYFYKIYTAESIVGIGKLVID